MTRAALWRALHRLWLLGAADVDARVCLTGTRSIDLRGGQACSIDAGPTHAQRDPLVSQQTGFGQEERADDSRQILFELAAIPSVVVAATPSIRSDRMAQIVGCCPRAVELGLRIGMTVAQAEAACPRMQVRADRWPARLAQLVAGRDEGGAIGRVQEVLRRFVVDSSCDALVLRSDSATWSVMLRRMAVCLERWIPRVAVESSGERRFGLLGDLAGCATLFRSTYLTEQRLMRRIAESFAARGFQTHLATASTIGAAVALAHYGFQDLRHGDLAESQGDGSHSGLRPRGRWRAAPRGRELEALESLPIEALRLSQGALEDLHAVEVRTIGQLARLRREGVAARMAGRIADEPDAHEPGRSGARNGIGVTGSTRKQRAATRRTGRRTASLRDEGSPVDSLFSSHFDSLDKAADAEERTRDSRSGEHGPGLPDLPSPGSGHTASGGECGAGALIGDRETCSPLVRLDQALGNAFEALIPLRLEESVVFTRAFEGPCSRLDAIFVACGQLVDQLATHLDARREGVRVSRWRFRHAELPMDLSTDASMDCAHERQMRGASLPQPGIRRRISEVELRLTAPSSSRIHLWSILRPRLEALPLDHGVEEIVVRLEEAARMRVLQQRLPLSSMEAATTLHAAATCTPRHEAHFRQEPTDSSATEAQGILPADGERDSDDHRSKTVAVPASMSAADRDVSPSTAQPLESRDEGRTSAVESPRHGRTPRLQDALHADAGSPAAWSGLHDACAGWVSVRHAASIAGRSAPDPETHSAIRARERQWIDLVAARFGRECIRNAASIGHGRDAYVAACEPGADAMANRAIHAGRRPSQFFRTEEPASVVGNGFSHALASCIAERRSWYAPSPCTPSSATIWPSLHWRGREWPVSAIDGWERIAARWWDIPATCRSDSVCWQPPPCDSATGEAKAHGQAATIALLSGRLHARLRVGSGLWIFVRLPERIGASPPVSRLHAQATDTSESAESRPEQLLSSRGSSCANVPEEARGDTGAHAGANPWPNSGAGSGAGSRADSSADSRADSWSARCEGAFRIGLPILVLGAWG